MGYHFLWEKCSCCGKKYKDHESIKIGTNSTIAELNSVVDRVEMVYDDSHEAENEIEIADKYWKGIKLK